MGGTSAAKAELARSHEDLARLAARRELLTQRCSEAAAVATQRREAASSAEIALTERQRAVARLKRRVHEEGELALLEANQGMR
jgi:hypothetical protein